MACWSPFSPSGQAKISTFSTVQYIILHYNAINCYTINAIKFIPQPLSNNNSFTCIVSNNNFFTRYNNIFGNSFCAWYLFKLALRTSAVLCHCREYILVICPPFNNDDNITNNNTKNNITILFCSDVDGVLRSANDTEFGLASGVFTNDLSKALEVCK